jgi:hypothetical protein
VDASAKASIPTERIKTKQEAINESLVSELFDFIPRSIDKRGFRLLSCSEDAGQDPREALFL